MSRFIFRYRARVALLLCMLLLLFGMTYWCSERLPASTPQSAVGELDFVKGVWINYIEYAKMIDGKSKEEYQETVQKALGELQSIGGNAVFLHLRSHSDSLYPSAVFPWSEQVNGGVGVPYDPLVYFVDTAHELGIQVHAWVNPYRISSGTLETLSPGNPAYSMRQDGNRVVETKSGVYYNPSSPRVRELVLDGVREILAKYNVDGVQYDDYFYPTTEESFDAVAYQQYCDITEHPMQLAEWRRCQVNLLIAGTYQLAHRYGVAFGVSPCADVEKNQNSLYADVSAWVKGGYVDYLCPQLYFGFDYPDEKFGFERLLQEWKNVADGTPLYIGLASYKVGQLDTGSEEWVTATDLLARQHCYSVEQGVNGVVIYHYTSLMERDDQAIAEKENLKRFWQT